MIGLILGETNFPNQILKTVKVKRLKYLIIDLTKRRIYKKNKKSFSVSLGQFGKIIKILKDNRCKKVLFAGNVKNQIFLELDWISKVYIICLEL